MAAAIRPGRQLVLFVRRPVGLAAVSNPQCMAVAFHTSQKLDILPAGPQVVSGTVNDAAPVPHANPAHGSYHWTFERLIALGMIPLTIAPFASGTANPMLDAVLCSTLILHSHIGFDACVVDYFPKRTYPKSEATMRWTLRAATIAAAVGLFSFQTNDVGLTEFIRRIWTA